MFYEPSDIQYLGSTRLRPATTFPSAEPRGIGLDLWAEPVNPSLRPAATSWEISSTPDQSKAIKIHYTGGELPMDVLANIMVHLEEINAIGKVTETGSILATDTTRGWQMMGPPPSVTPQVTAINISIHPSVTGGPMVAIMGRLQSVMDLLEAIVPHSAPPSRQPFSDTTGTPPAIPTQRSSRQHLTTPRPRLRPLEEAEMVSATSAQFVQKFKVTTPGPRFQCRRISSGFEPLICAARLCCSGRWEV